MSAKTLSRAELLTFVREHRYGALGTSAGDGSPQVALMGLAVTDEFEFLFDTLGHTRKVANLRRDARCALTFGSTLGDDHRTLQVEGLADELHGSELERLKPLYFAAFPQGRERVSWPGLTYWRVRPHWARFSDFGATPPLVLTHDATALANLR